MDLSQQSNVSAFEYVHTYYYIKLVTNKNLLNPDRVRHDLATKQQELWILIGRTDAEAEAPIFWLLDVNGWLIGKDPDAGKD